MYKRLSQQEYSDLLKKIDREYFFNFFKLHSNKSVMNEFKNIWMSNA